MSDKQPTMMTIREVAKTGILSEYALRLLVKDRRLLFSKLVRKPLSTLRGSVRFFRGSSLVQDLPLRISPLRRMLMLEALKAEKRWFCWKLEQVSGRQTKVPYSALTGKHTGTSDNYRSSWTDFNKAASVCAEKGFSGVGFKIPENMFFLDIDHISPEDLFVESIATLLDTYVEKSQSGNGVHFYGYINIDRLPISKDNGKVHFDKKYYQKHPTNEMELYFGYLTNIYASFTGNAFNESELKDCTDEVLAILEQYMLREQKTSNSAKPKKKHKTSVDYDFAEEPDSEYKELQFYEIPHDAPEEVQQIIYSL